MRYCNLFFLLFFSLLAFTQTKDDTHTISVNYNDRNTYYSAADLTPWKNLSESGSFNEIGLKTGFWIEYPIDTSILASKNNIKYDSLKKEIFKPDLVKQVGNYNNGKRNNKWTFYVKSGAPGFEKWVREKEINYKIGDKQGLEITFNVWGQDTLVVMKYDKSTPIEMRTYRQNSSLETISKKIGDKYMRFYYDTKGNLISKEEIKQ